MYSRVVENEVTLHRAVSGDEGECEWYDTSLITLLEARDVPWADEVLAFAAMQSILDCHVWCARVVALFTLPAAHVAIDV